MRGKVLVACEYSGVVRDAFLAAGHDAISCDIVKTERDGPHYLGDVADLLSSYDWDMIIAFPPCTDLSAIGAASWKKKQQDGRQQRAAQFFRSFLESDCPLVAVENPVGWLNTNYRKPDQIVQPFQFGDPWRKLTCLWLKNLPKLHPTDIVDPVGYWVGSQRHGRGKKAQGTWRKDETGVWGSKNPKIRARTFQGIADAMATQWGPLIKEKLV